MASSAGGGDGNAVAASIPIAVVVDASANPSQPQPAVQAPNDVVIAVAPLVAIPSVMIAIAPTIDDSKRTAPSVNSLALNPPHGSEYSSTQPPVMSNAHPVDRTPPTNDFCDGMHVWCRKKGGVMDDVLPAGVPIANREPSYHPPLIRLNSTQTSLKLNLAEMGFGGDIIEQALLESNASTVEQAIEAIIRIMNSSDGKANGGGGRASAAAPLPVANNYGSTREVCLCPHPPCYREEMKRWLLNMMSLCSD